MRKKIIGFMVAGILFLVLGFVSTPASAELSLGLVGSYYSPNYGEVNDYLDEMNTFFGTDLEFKAGMMYGLALGYDLPPRFGLRLEYGSFEPKTSDTVSEGLPGILEYRTDIDLKLTVTPVVLSGIYKFSPFYIGAGVGSFSTKAKATWTYEEYFLGVLVDSESESESDSDSPTGFVLLAGYGFGGESPFLNLEARYVVGTKAKLKDIETEVDLSGLQLSLLGGFKF